MEHLAFTFHKTAFKDRLETLKIGLKTVDHLKKYKPRHSRSSKVLGGIISPLTFGLGKTPIGTPYHEKSHFLSPSRPGTPEVYDDGHAGDSEDNTPASSKKGKAKQKRVRVKVDTSNLSGMSTPASGAGSPTTASAPIAKSGQLFTNSTVDEHTYPPAQSPNTSGAGTPSRKSSEDQEGVVLHAAKALKTAVLHDARNIVGKGDEEEISLGWSVSSTHEAKVGFFDDSMKEA